MKKISPFILFLLISIPAFAAYPNYTVCPSACDFSTLAGAVGDLESNHAVPASPVTITISGSWSAADTAAVNITGITITSSNTLTISTTGTARSNGILPSGGGGYWMKPASGDAITINGSYVTINGLAFDMTTSGGNAIFVSQYSGGFNIIGNFGKFTDGSLFSVNNGSLRLTNYAYNNVCIGNATQPYNSCIDFEGGDGATQFYVYNNSAYSMGRGYITDSSGSIYVFTNNVASNSVTNSIYRPQNSSSGSNNVCDDSSSCTTSPLTSGTNNATSYTSYYNSPSTGNLSLISGSILIGGGVSESGTFTTDVTGATRTTWDVGAFEFLSVSTTSTITGGTINAANNI